MSPHLNEQDELDKYEGIIKAIDYDREYELILPKGVNYEEIAGRKTAE